MTDMEERVRRAEEAAKENKSALAQLISHTKNVERAVTLSQQVTSRVTHVTRDTCDT